MSGFRQERVAELIKRELSQVFQRESRSICKGALVSVTAVRITGDMSLAKVYISIFGHDSKEEVFEGIQENGGYIRKMVGNAAKDLRRIPELRFYIDDSLDYAENIDNLLKG